MSTFSDKENIGFNLMFSITNTRGQVLPDLEKILKFEFQHEMINEFYEKEK